MNTYIVIQKSTLEGFIQNPFLNRLSIVNKKMLFIFYDQIRNNFTSINNESINPPMINIVLKLF